MENNKIQQLQNIIYNCNDIVFFGGAGVSTESGIPDFRSIDGLYNQQYKYPPEKILSHNFFLHKPIVFYEFYRNKILCFSAKPNKAHLFLADLENKEKLKAIITQNIDGLHQQAGSKKVYELHGNVHRNYCMKCGEFYSGKYISDAIGVPICKKCGGKIKPDVVLYEEELDDKTIAKSINAILSADCLIIAGTSLTVYPAAGLIRYFKGKHLVLINKSKTSVDNTADLVINAPVGEVLSKIKI